MLAFLPADEHALASVPGMSVGILSATQGSYEPAQMLLDIGQGARISSSAYDGPVPALPLGFGGGGAEFPEWEKVVSRARDAPQLLEPGLLAASIPGGAGFVGAGTQGTGGAFVATDRAGRIAGFSLGSVDSLVGRIAAMGRRRRLVVADLPSGPTGLADLRSLNASRRPGELLLAVEAERPGPGRELLWTAIAGLPGGGDRALTSRTTNERGLISSIDIAPTILGHLGLAVPSEMRGAKIESDGALHGASLRSLMARLHVVGGRRLKAFGVLLCAWAALLLGAALLPGRSRGDGEPGDIGNAAARAWAIRVGALGVLWAPTAVLVTAALEPGAAVEYLAIAAICLGLGALADALLPWPRAPLAPAAVSILAVTVDALAHTQLLVRSLLGPNPILGARFYGFGNELKPALAVLALAALAAVLYPAARSRRGALLTGGVGIVLALVEGAARIGAGVGGAILVAAGFAVAALLLWPGEFSRRRALIAIGAPVLALVLLALIDLATAHGSGHYTGSILHASSASEVRDVIERRYAAAWRELRNHAMPFATAIALVAAVLGVRRRERLLAPVGGDPAWLAALGGGLAAGIAGTLVEDSGPVLLVVATFALGCVCAYLWGRPPSSSAPPYVATASAITAVEGGSEGIS